MSIRDWQVGSLQRQVAFFCLTNNLVAFVGIWFIGLTGTNQLQFGRKKYSATYLKITLFILTVKSKSL